MERDIILIDRDRCNGCGQCVNGCPEGALKVIDGKACLVSELVCDGLGACIGTCPQGAITIERRQAAPYDERAVMETIIKQGPSVIRAHLDHLETHGQEDYFRQALAFLKEKGLPVPPRAAGKGPACGCPGSRVVDRRRDEAPAAATAAPAVSELRQWPVQLALLNPHAPYFKNADLVIAADCVPLAFGDFHRAFLRGRTVAVFCPKLDGRQEEYVEKLAEIFRSAGLRSVTTVHMEVPCCFGLVQAVKDAMERSGKNIPVTDVVVTVEGAMECAAVPDEKAGAGERISR